MNMNPVFCQDKTEIIVPFFDVDSLMIVWHGHYIKYLEIARCAFLAKIQHDYNVMRQTGYAYPIVKLDLKYIKPASFGQKIEVHMAVIEFESCFKVRYRIIDQQTGELLTKATTTQAAVCIETGQMQFQTPAVFQQAIRHFSGMEHHD